MASRTFSRSYSPSGSISAAFLIILPAFLSACAIPGSAVDFSGRRPVDLKDTPFFAQTDYQCGPAALATVLGASGLTLTPDDLVPKVYTPGRKGSLQIDIVAATRGYARIPYIIDPEIDHLLDELDAARPVLVLQNLGLSFKPEWHYAVATGYDPDSGEIYLRSGIERRKTMRMRNFQRTWQLAGSWGLVALKPGEQPANADSGRLLEAVVAMETNQGPVVMARLYRGFLEQFPENHIAMLGLANAHLNHGDLRRAIDLYRRILTLDGGNVAAGNNLAIALSQANCPASAVAQAQATARVALDSNTFTVESKRTLEQILSNEANEFEEASRADLCN